MDSWSLTVDIPAERLVSVRRKGGSRLVQMAIGIPAVHNVHDRSRRHAVKGTQEAALDAGLLLGDQGAPTELRRRLQLGERFDLLLVRRAPQPLDSAIQHGDWRRGGRTLYGDNASSAVKLFRDWTAKRVFGLTGDSSPLLRWHVGQEWSGKPRLYQIGVLIMPAAERWYELPDRWLRREL